MALVTYGVGDHHNHPEMSGTIQTRGHRKPVASITDFHAYTPHDSPRTSCSRFRSRGELICHTPDDTPDDTVTYMTMGVNDGLQYTPVLKVWSLQ